MKIKTGQVLRNFVCVLALILENFAAAQIILPILGPGVKFIGDDREWPWTPEHPEWIITVCLSVFGCLSVCVCVCVCVWVGNSVSVCVILFEYLCLSVDDYVNMSVCVSVIVSKREILSSSVCDSVFMRVRERFWVCLIDGWGNCVTVRPSLCP